MSDFFHGWRRQQLTAIADACWFVFMRGVIWIAYAVAVLMWMLVALVYISAPHIPTIDRIATCLCGGMPFVIVSMVDGFIRRKATKNGP